MTIAAKQAFEAHKRILKESYCDVSPFDWDHISHFERMAWEAAVQAAVAHLIPRKSEIDYQSKEDYEAELTEILKVVQATPKQSTTAIAEACELADDAMRNRLNALATRKLVVCEIVGNRKIWSAV